MKLFFYDNTEEKKRKKVDVCVGVLKLFFVRDKIVNENKNLIEF